MALTIQEFWQLVVASGLHDEENCRRLADAFANARDSGQIPRTTPLPEWLLSTRAMSRYQAKVLLAGLPGPFVYGDYVVADRLEGTDAAGLFRAVHRPTGVNCCLHFLSEKALADRSIVAALAAEATAAAKASRPTPYLTHCHTLVDLGAYKFLVIDELPTATLAEKLSRHTALGAKEAARVLCQVAAGLARLHDANQVHGAIRPDRIWLASDGMARLATFPLARNPMTLVGAHVGWDVEPDAIDYCPPECSTGEMPTPCGDIYSLGCTLYQMLSGRVPFPGDDPQQTLLAHRSMTPPPLDQLNPAVPKTLAALVTRMMAKEPGARFSDARQLATSLAPLAKQFGMTADSEVPPPDRVKLEKYLSASGALASQAAAAAATARPIMFAPHDVTTTTATMIARQQRSRRAKLPAMIGAVAALLIVAGGAIFLISSGVLEQPAASPRANPLPSIGQAVPLPDAVSSDAAPTDIGKAATTAREETPVAAPAELTPSIDTVVGLDATMWASPTHGPPLNLAYVVPAAEILVALRPAQLVGQAETEKILDPRTTGWLGTFVKDELSELLNTPLAGIERVIIAVLDSADGSPRWALVGYLRDPCDQEALLAKWGQPEPHENDGITYYQQGERAFYIPAAGEGRAIVIGPAELIVEEVLPAGDNAPALGREIETLLATSDADRDVTILASPSILLTGSKAWLPGVTARLRAPLESFFSGNERDASAGPTRSDADAPPVGSRPIDVSSQGLPKAVLASAHLSETDLFAELRIYVEPNHPAQALARAYRERMTRLPKHASDYIRTLALSDYSRDVLFGFPLMVEQLGRYTVVGTDHRQIVLRAYLPSMAAHNLALGLHLTLLERERPPATGAAGPSSAAAASESTSATASEPLAKRLDHKISLVFDRATLEKALQMVAEELGTDVVILGPDLQAEGITKNQSFGLAERDQSARKILQKIMLRANADGKLVYVIKPPPGGSGEALYITTRAAAKGRGESLPAEFTDQP